MTRLFAHLKKYTKECVLAPLFKLLEAVLELFVPLVVAAIIDEGLPSGNTSYIFLMVGILFVLAITGLAVSITAQYFSARAAAFFARDAKKTLFRHIESFSQADSDKMGRSTLINRMTGDMNQVQSGVNMTLRLLLRSPFVVLGAAIMAFWVDVRAAVIFVVIIPLLSIIVYVLLRITVPGFKKVQSRLDGQLARTRENYRGARVIRAFNLQQSEADEFVQANEELVKSQLRVGAISVLTNPMTSFVVNLGIIAVIYYGGIRVNFGTLTQGSTVALYNYMSQILVELIKLASLIQTITRALASARRIEDVLAKTSSMADGSLETIDYSQPAIEFKDVSFAYNEGSESALKHISFTLEKGQTLGIIGATGSGKSTLAALIDRLYDADEGEVKIFGRNIRDYSISFLHRHISLVLQKARLFKGTIRSNLALANPEAGEAEIVDALRDAEAWSFVEEKGLDATVEAGGRNFSGGQRQRLSIARGLVTGSDILILDDSFSALDYATDARLRANIQKRNLTKIIISQRASSIMSADLILLLENGEILARGDHEELMKTSPVYREIYHTQFEKEAD